jgi:hypothetical protein
MPLVSPGNRGLNKQAETSILDQSWATVATNAVFDTAGRIAAREGWVAVTTSPMSGTPTVEQIFDQISELGVSTTISAAGSKLWSGTTSPTDVTGTATVTVGNNWQFLNFNGNLYGVQQGEQPIVRSTGNFADATATSGSWPQGNCGVVHSGRLWIAGADYQTIQYCALLDPAHWTTGAGSIDMTSVWPQGTDTIVALAMYNGQMVVFGRDRIVIFGDGQGSELGIDPAQIYVIDTVVGVGCVARDSVRQIEGGDLLFLSSQGVQSLSRLIQEKSNPIENVTKNVRDYLTAYTSGANKDQIRSVYSPENSFYLLSIPGVVTFCLDTSGRMEDGSFRVTEWTGLTPRGVARAADGTLYMSLPTGADGKIGKYDGYQDNGAGYTFDYVSAWLDLGEDAAKYVKILKNLSGLFWISSEASLSMKWDFDFQGDFATRNKTLASPGVAEWGIMEWGLFEWGGGTVLRSVRVPATGQGQYIRVGVSVSISGSSFAIQKMTLFTKIGRLAR